MNLSQQEYYCSSLCMTPVLGLSSFLAVGLQISVRCFSLEEEATECVVERSWLAVGGLFFGLPSFVFRRRGQHVSTTSKYCIHYDQAFTRRRRSGD